MKKKSPKIANKSKVVPSKKIDKSIEIFGVRIFSNHTSQLLRKITLQRKEMLHVATVNPEYLMEARGNSKFKEILTQSLCVADGHGVVWATKILLGTEAPRISGVELAEKMIELAHDRGEKVFLLGASLGTGEKAARLMSKKYPQAQISWYEGAKTVKVEKSEEASMTIAKINSIEPDYLLVAYGSPWQDLWIEENRPYLRVRVAMGVGGALDEWAGTVKVCPVWVDKLGMKWLWRVVHEPWRWRRVMRVWQFGLLVLWQKIQNLWNQG